MVKCLNDEEFVGIVVQAVGGKPLESYDGRGRV